MKPVDFKRNNRDSTGSSISLRLGLKMSVQSDVEAFRLSMSSSDIIVRSPIAQDIEDNRSRFLNATISFIAFIILGFMGTLFSIAADKIKEGATYKVLTGIACITITIAAISLFFTCFYGCRPKVLSQGCT